MIPHFTVIIGAAKAGTTSLFHYLAEHPQIAQCRRKEPSFFTSEEQFAAGREAYEALWHWDPARHRTALEASTTYSVFPVYPSAAQRMATFSAGTEFRLIYVVRNPIEQIESNFAYSYALGSAWTDPQAGWWTGSRVNKYFLATASYASQLDEYCRHFSRDQITLVDFDELRSSTRPVLERLCRFIGVDPDFRFQAVDVVHNPTSEQVSPRPFWVTARRLKTLRSIYHQLPARLRFRISRSLGKKGYKAALTPAERIEAAVALRPDAVRLEREYGFDITAWRESLGSVGEGAGNKAT